MLASALTSSCVISSVEAAAVSEEEAVLRERAEALARDMARLKEKKIHLQLAKYEADLQKAAARKLAKVTAQVDGDFQVQHAKLAAAREERIESMATFEAEVEAKIAQMRGILEDLRGKRTAFEAEYRRSEEKLQRKRSQAVRAKQKELQEEVMRLLKDAAAQEGWEVQRIEQAVPPTSPPAGGVAAAGAAAGGRATAGEKGGAPAAATAADAETAMRSRRIAAQSQQTGDGRLDAPRAAWDDKARVAGGNSSSSSNGGK